MEAFMDLLTGDAGISLWSFFMLCGVSFLGSFIAAALGLGGGILVLATMALVLPPTALIPIHGAVQVGSNLGRMALLYRQVLTSVVPAFLIGSVLGAAIGAQVVVSLPTGLLQAVLALFVLYATWAPRLQVSRPRKKTFFGVGVLSSFITMFVGATGPLIAPFVSAASDERQQMVATHAMLMFIQHTFKIIFFGMLGFAFGPYVPLLVGLLVFGFAGTYAGRHVLNRLPERVFRIGLKTILTLLALRLFYGAASSFLG